MFAGMEEGYLPTCLAMQRDRSDRGGLDKMTVAGTNQQIPLVKTKSDAYYEYGTIHVTLES